MSEAIEALLSETRRFPPPAEFTARARISSPEIYAEADADFRAFWHGHALREITWFKEPAEVLDDSNPPFYKWFADGELNVSYNCLDRHIAERRRRQDRADLDRRARRGAAHLLPGAARRGGAAAPTR